MSAKRRRPRVRRLRRREDTLGLARAAGYEEIVIGTHREIVDLGAPVRRDALLALADLQLPSPPAPEILNAIEAAMHDKSEEVAAAAVEALSHASEDPAARDALVRAAALSLPMAGHIKAQTRAIEQIVTFERGAAVSLARGMIERDGNFRLTDADQEILVRVLEATTGEAVADEDVLEVLTTGLADERQAVRERAEQGIRWFASEAVEYLLGALGRPAIRAEAVYALGVTRDLRAVPALCEALDDQSRDVRRAAAHALGEVKTPRAIESLLSATDDEDYGVRSEAIAALDGLGTVGIVASIDSLARATRSGPSASPRSLPSGASALVTQLAKPRSESLTVLDPLSIQNGRRTLWPGLRRILERRRPTTRPPSPEYEISPSTATSPPPE